jgi:hypothetical protein
MSRRTKYNGYLILYIREIKDGDDPTCCSYDHLPSPAGNLAPIPTLMWDPAHSPPGTVRRKAAYPTFAQIQVKGGTASV